MKAAFLPPLALVVRKARSDDAEAVHHLRSEVDEFHARLVPTFFRQPTPTEAGAAPNPKTLHDPDQALWVAEAKHEVVGLVHAALFDTPPDATLVQERRLHVDVLVVARAYRRHGVGRRLLQAAEQWGRARGAKKCVLSVWTGNRAADRFYDALGYQTLQRVLVCEL